MKVLHRLRVASTGALAAWAMVSCPSLLAATFGSGANSFDMEFVRISATGNPADVTDFGRVGAVDYVYLIGKHEVSRGMVEKANADGGLGISLFEFSTPERNEPNHAASGVTWNEAARFVNWLNQSKGFPHAYKFLTQPGDLQYDVTEDIRLWTSEDAGFDPDNRFRNTEAHFFLPSVHEWHKAAYYDPKTNSYNAYPTGNTLPMSAPNGTLPNSAVYGQPLGAGPVDIKSAGGRSPLGTMAQGGSVAEWDETEFDLDNDDPSAVRGWRGGAWFIGDIAMLSDSRAAGNTFTKFGYRGFRVAAIPEPGSLGSALLLSVLLTKRTRYRVHVRSAQGAVTKMTYDL
jgi:hypothetical protein